MIRSSTIEDATRISEIYNHYVLHSTITFEEQAVPADEMRQRIAKVLEGLPWLIWVEDHAIQGFTYASKWKGRCAYRYSAESTVYLAEGSTGKGIGSTLEKVSHSREVGWKFNNWIDVGDWQLVFIGSSHYLRHRCFAKSGCLSSPQRRVESLNRSKAEVRSPITQTSERFDVERKTGRLTVGPTSELEGER